MMVQGGPDHASPSHGVLYSALERLNPAWFAMVMATGIVSIAAHAEGFSTIPKVLLWVNICFYGVLSLLYLVRVVAFPRMVVADLENHIRGMGFFTLSAGSAVLGSQLLIVGGWSRAALVFWFIALALWVVLIYTLFIVLAVEEKKPDLGHGISGTWLIAIVATQGVSLLGGGVADQFGRGAEEVIFFTLAMWLFGGMLYIWIMGLILYRFLFLRLEPEQLSTTFWINMGAVAITTLAGATLILEAAKYPVTAGMVQFLQGFTVWFWAVATWWIPWLIAMGVWRYAVRRYPIRFDPSWWAMVFPLGMYTFATYKLGDALNFLSLQHISSVTIWAALAAWLVTFVLMIAAFIHRPLRSDAV